MILKVSKKKTLITFVIMDVIFAIFLFVSCINLFLSKDWDIKQWLIIGLWVIISIFMLLMSLFRYFYEVTNKYVKVVKGRKELYYYYNDVVYIDEEQSVKKKCIAFFTKQGHCRYLDFDKENKLYTLMLEKCKNRISKDDFVKNYPKVKL